MCRLAASSTKKLYHSIIQSSKNLLRWPFQALKRRKWARNQPPSQHAIHPTSPLHHLEISSELRDTSSSYTVSRLHSSAPQPQNAPPSAPMPPQPRQPSPFPTTLPPLPRAPNNFPPNPHKPPNLGYRRHNITQTRQPILLRAPLLHPRSTARPRRRPHLGHRPDDTTARSHWLQACHRRNVVQSGAFHNRGYYLYCGSCDEWRIGEAF